MSARATDHSGTGELLHLARIDFAVFCTAVKRGFETPPHILLLVEKLERVARGELRRLILSMPPRHGKSLLTSILFVAWRLGLDPAMQVIFATYSAELAEDFGRAVRNLLSDPVFQAIFPECRLSDDSAAAYRFNTTGGGFYVATGVGGAITGRGADLLLIDDPLKGYEEAHSAAIRKALHSWFGSVAFTRLQPGGAVIVISTRWHLDDLAGRLLREHLCEGWESVSLPAIADENDPLGRSTGQALWPERFPLQVLQSIRAQSGSAVWTSLYMQNPIAAEGAVFLWTWWQTFDATAPPTFQRVIQSWDTAFKTGTENDFSVCTTWGVTASGYYLLHLWRARAEFPELKRTMVSLFELWKPTEVLIEDKASGQSLLQELRRETRLPIKAVSVDKDKRVRAQAITPLIEGGRTFIPQAAPWLDIFLDEMCSFPAGAHDDIVDSVSQALNELREPETPAIILWYEQKNREAEEARAAFVAKLTEEDTPWHEGEPRVKL